MLNRGFTLIELMVSIAIIVIVSSAVMVGRNGAEQTTTLRTTAFLLGQNLRELQEKALSGENNACGGKAVCGFGIHFSKTAGNNTSYTQFVDCSNNCAGGGHSFGGDDINLSVVPLDKSKICDISSGNSLNVIFSSPDPIVYFGNTSWGEEQIITLCLVDNIAITRKINLNNAGKIEIQ